MDQAIPPEAWDAISKGGNAAAMVLGVLYLRITERFSKLSERVTVLETKLNLKGSTNDPA